MLTVPKIAAELQNESLEFSKILGEGSFGKVISVKSSVDSCSYAVKLLENPDGSGNEDEDQRKYNGREIELLKKTVNEARNLNIIRYYKNWEARINDKRILFIIMELCNESLGDTLANNPAIAKDENFYYYVFPQILTGLEGIHDLGWVHRDIHPSNILIKESISVPVQQIYDGMVKIADFGYARELSPTSTNLSRSQSKLSAVGNIYYRAPEMNTGNYDNKVDMYSAGIVLYLLCCNFDNENLVIGEISALRKEAEEGRVSEARLSGHGDKSLHEVFRGLLNQNPGDRLSAKGALEKFKHIKAVSGSCKVILRKEGESDFVSLRGTSIFSPLSDIKRAAQEVTGIDADSQDLVQESYDEKDQSYTHKIRDEADWRSRAESAKEKGLKKMKLIVRCCDKLEKGMSEGIQNECIPMEVDNS